MGERQFRNIPRVNHQRQPLATLATLRTPAGAQSAHVAHRMPARSPAEINIMKISYERTYQGAWRLSAMYNGEYYTHQYFDYTKREAREEFIEHIAMEDRKIARELKR